MENQESIYEEKQGNLLTGILGALLGALIGTALWVLVGVWGYVASIVAWLTAFLAGKGYDLLHGRPGKAKAITIIVMLILSICVGTVGTATVIMVQSYNQQISEMNTFEQARIQKYGPTVEEYVQSMFMEQDIQTEIVKNLALGMLFGALGAYPIVLGDRRKKQRQDTVQPYEAADGAPKSTENADDTDSIWMLNHIKQTPYRKINPVRRFFAFMVFAGAAGKLRRQCGVDFPTAVRPA